MNRMILAILVAFAVLLKTGISLAEIDKLDVRGLVPGESNWNEVAQIVKSNRDHPVGNKFTGQINLGGINFSFCEVGFSADGTFAYLHCPLNRVFNDAHKSNQQQFSHLFDGFQNKFGLPSTVDDSIVQNSFGAQYNKQEVQWIDKSGNVLYLTNLFGSIDIGLLYLQSSKYIAEEREKEAKEKDGNF